MTSSQMIITLVNNYQRLFTMIVIMIATIYWALTECHALGQALYIHYCLSVSPPPCEVNGIIKGLSNLPRSLNEKIIHLSSCRYFSNSAIYGQQWTVKTSPRIRLTRTLSLPLVLILLEGIPAFCGPKTVTGHPRGNNCSSSSFPCKVLCLRTRYSAGQFTH